MLPLDHSGSARLASQKHEHNGLTVPEELRATSVSVIPAPTPSPWAMPPDSSGAVALWPRAKLARPAARSCAKRPPLRQSRAHRSSSTHGIPDQLRDVLYTVATAGSSTDRVWMGNRPTTQQPSSLEHIAKPSQHATMPPTLGLTPRQLLGLQIPDAGPAILQ